MELLTGNLSTLEYEELFSETLNVNVIRRKIKVIVMTYKMTREFSLKLKKKLLIKFIWDQLSLAYNNRLNLKSQCRKVTNELNEHLLIALSRT